ncbi:hypothetical protein PINS_up018194 [Pythium insidiosum]|nr:hypothetical protein PINS_up018194 [Pythium insidiosum]
MHRHVAMSDRSSSQTARSSAPGSRSRKDSVDSATSDRSDRGKSRRWERKTSSGGYSRRSLGDDDGRTQDYRSSLSRYDDSRPALGRLERSSSDSTKNNSTHRGSSDRSEQDVRYVEGSTLSMKPVTRSSQDVRFSSPVPSRKVGGPFVDRVEQRKSNEPGRSVQPPLKEASGTSDAPFASSLTSSLTSELAATDSPRPAKLDDVEDRRRQAAERLRERLEKSSLTERLQREQGLGVTRVGDDTRMPRSSVIIDKERRTREHFDKIRREDEQKEAMRRATSAPFQSSLLVSLSNQQPRATSRSNGSVGKKIVFSILELRRMKTLAQPRPTDLRDMRIGDVIEVEPPRRAMSGKRGSTRRSGTPSRTLGKDGKGLRGASNINKKDRRGGGRRGGPPAPPPPLFDGPVEPLKLTENRWVKKTNLNELESTLSRVKSVLNKLTRENFEKLTGDLCKTEMKSLEMLRLVISVIIDKALEEPGFADVYADLCREFHKQTTGRAWNFLHAVRNHVKGTYFWTASSPSESDYVGTFASEEACLQAIKSDQAHISTSCEVRRYKVHATEDALVFVGEASTSGFAYKIKSLADLGEDEPLMGEFESENDALADAIKQTSFKRLLVTRCQAEFEKWTKRTSNTDARETSAAIDDRERQLAAQRAKRSMLGNIRFIGELYKTDLIQASVVQACLLHLLGLELIHGDVGAELAGNVIRSPDEDDIEAMCKLLGTVGKKFDDKKRQQLMKIVILRLVELSEDKTMPSRSRFLVKDLLEMRDHLWEPRRKELQKKTLEEVRREAKQLQSQGKNAQHDSLNKRRLKSQISSIQLAKQSSNLLLHKEIPTASEDSHEPAGVVVDVSKIEYRVKSIIQEYASIRDIDEAVACLQEIPPSHRGRFAEEAVNRALEGMEQERVDVVELLVLLYERGAIDAASVQVAIQSGMEFLDDLRIDIPLVHEYAGYLVGRLIAAGCFGLSWLLSHGMKHLIDSGMASLVFAESLHAIDADSDEKTVARMLADEEITASAVLPRNRKSAEAEFIESHGLSVYFGGERDDDEDEDDTEELDPKVESKMRSTLEEFISIKDVSEVILCVKELEEEQDHCWHHFVRICALYAIDADSAIRRAIAELYLALYEQEAFTVDDIQSAIEVILDDYDDLRVDIPLIASCIAELLTPLFNVENGLTLEWMQESSSHLISSGEAVKLLSALLTEFDAQLGRERLIERLQPQVQASDWWKALAAASPERMREVLRPWEEILA